MSTPNCALFGYTLKASDAMGAYLIVPILDMSSRKSRNARFLTAVIKLQGACPHKVLIFFILWSP